MTKEEARSAVFHIIATVDIQSDTKENIMRVVSKRLKCKADDNVVEKIIEEILKESGENE